MTGVLCMTQNVLRISSSVRMEDVYHPRGCVTEITTAETTQMNRTVVCIRH